MASPRVVYGFMHEIITSRINSPAAPRFDRPRFPKGVIKVERSSMLLRTESTE